MDITHDNVCSSMLSCFYSHLLSTGRPISSLNRFRAYFKGIFSDQEYIAKINCNTEKFQASWSVFHRLKNI